MKREIKFRWSIIFWAGEYYMTGGGGKTKISLSRRFELINFV